MIIEFILALLLGILAGTISGITPGIHINLIAIFLISVSNFFLSYTSPMVLVIFIVAMSICHSFLDFIPSIFLGAPEDGTELSVLPGPEMLKKVQGFQAVHLASVGCLYGLFIFS